MKHTNILISLLMTVVVLMTPVFTVHAVQAVGSSSVNDASSLSYLHGDLYIWQEGRLQTNVGNYEINDLVVVTDQTNSFGQNYTDFETKPKVRLIFDKKKLKEVLIYR